MGRGKHGRHRVLAVLAALGLLVSTATAALGADQFSDVPDDHPFHDEIGWLADVGISGGYADGTFRPASVVSRQAAAVFLYRMAQEPHGNFQSNFADVGVSHPFYTEISWAAEQGYVTGYPDATFRPTAPASRQAWAVFLWRFANSPPISYSNNFSDVGQSHPFHEEISWVAGNDIANGYPDGTFRPDNPVTRVAAAAFIYRYAEGAGAI